MNGLMRVYIRISHNRKIAYLRTDKFVSVHEVSKRGEIKDSFVIRYCYDLIERFGARLNSVDYTGWSAIDIRNYLKGQMRGSVTFSEFCGAFIERKRKSSEGNAHSYEMALKSLSRFMACDDIRFGDLSGTLLRNWIDSLEIYSRARNLYPKCVKVMYDAAERASRDGRSGIEALRDIWNGVLIPRYVSTRKLAISAQACREFFDYELPEAGHGSGLLRLGHDVAMMVFCLAGMNTVDLYDLKRADVYDGVVHYRRRKTSSRRSDGAYFEMRVPPVLKDVFERWKASEDSEKMFCFAQRYRDAKLFNISVNNGIKKLCALLGLKELYSAYTFRHTWATLAQNDVGANLSEIGFGLNHSVSSITRGYIKIDFSPAWRLNEAVVGLVFGESNPDLNEAVAKGSDPEFSVSPRHMVYARAYFRGEIIGELSDIGFGSVEEIVERFAGQLPSSLPVGACVQFRIKDVDADREVVYSRTL